ncbi:MAG: 6-phosphogluconolactonase [Paracoccaceae bacterium]
MTFKEYPDRDMLAIDVANALAGELETCLFSHETASLAVSGGTTPGPIFDALCAADLDWSRVRVLLTDERWVPQDHERSNTRLLRERLFVNRAAKAVYLPLYVPADEPEEVLPELEAKIAPELPISLALFGMGADMHTASLFPGGSLLEAALDPNAPILMPMRIDGQPETRITLTAPVLDGALSKHLVIYGAAKRDVFEKAAGMPPEQAPINAVLSGMTVHWAE